MLKTHFFNRWICLLGFLAYAVTQFAHAEEMAVTPPEALLHEHVYQRSFDEAGVGVWGAELEMTLFLPEGNGPFPLVVMNHGSAHQSDTHAEPRYRASYSIWYFLSRGYAVVLPMMRGYGHSGGNQIAWGCNQYDIGIANARDIGAVVNDMAQKPYIDPQRIIVAGQSFGGWNALALASLNPPLVKAVVNFVGGIDVQNCQDNKKSLMEGAAKMGSTTTIPSIWFYGDNDSIFPTATWQAVYQSYKDAGGNADLFDIGNFIIDSHNMLGRMESLPLWTPKLDAFLQGIGMPHQLKDARYLPTPFPPASHYAMLDNVNAVPYITNVGRALYQEFLKTEKPRVFLVATGEAFLYSGGFDPLGTGLKACSDAGKKCQVYAVDDIVTWTRPTPAPAPTHFAPLMDSKAIPYIGDDGRLGYEKFLKGINPKAFVIAPNGSWAAAGLGYDPIGRALSNCSKWHVGCKLYVVDNEVVWSPPEKSNAKNLTQLSESSSILSEMQP